MAYASPSATYLIFGTGSKIDTSVQLNDAPAQLKSWGRRAKGTLHLLMFFTFTDAIFLCAFYGIICLAFADFVVKQDSSSLYLAPYCLIPLAGRFVMRCFIAKTIARVSYLVEGAVREELITKLLRVGPLSFAVKSSLSTMFTDALDDIMPYFSSFLVTLRYAMVIPVVCLIAVAMVSPGSALILFLMAPMIPVFMILIGRGAERLNRRQWKQITRLAVRFAEALDKLSLLKLFNIERQEIAKIARLTKRWRVETMQVLRIAFLSALVLEFFATCGIAICAVTLGFAVYQHGFDYTKALFVLLLAPEFFLPLRQLGATYHAKMRALGAMSGLMELLHERNIFPDPQLRSGAQLNRLAAEAEANASAAAATAATAATAADTAASAAAEAAADAGAGAPVGAPAGGADAGTAAPAWLQQPYVIEFKGVDATYPNGRVGLKDFSTIFEPGVITALVGPSGAGKSTVLQTVAGFTEVSAGTLKINGHVCEREDLIKFMSTITYIPQLPNLLFGTLRDNLRLGAPEASDDDLIAALKAVGADHLLTRFADGLDHHVGDHNRGISGGETRLIALARAMLRDSPVLLLDEPTASLDRDSENRFLEALRILGKDKTVIVVAHRQELIDFADKVIEVIPQSAVIDDDEQPRSPNVAAEAAAASVAVAADKAEEELL